jgi:aryl-alcohol dehydrogenase-like predicted oxidoreductase
METRRLGRIGHESTVLIYGGAALFRVAEEVADSSIQLALDAGINHFDTAADYGDSELHLGRWMGRIRERIFLATKTGERLQQPAYDSVRRSLERLQTDHVDLIQLHSVGNMDELDTVTSRSGAYLGVMGAKEEGLAGAVGITGHGMQAPAVHLEALKRFPFDTVLTPWNWRLSQFPDYRRDFEALVQETQTQHAGLMIIKTAARNLWKQGRQTLSTWYEPLTEQRWIDAAVAFTLGTPGVTGICTPGDTELLPQLIEAERRRAEWTPEAIAEELSAVPELESPFLRQEGRVVPDWLEHLVPG